MAIHVRVLGSSSGGNCTVLWDERSALLIDCGFSARYIGRHLKELNLSFRSLAGVLITHTHGDHVHQAALSRLVEEGIPIVSPPGVLEVLEKRYPMLAGNGTKPVRALGASGLEVGPFGVSAFPVPHDAPGGCFGYQVDAGGGEDRRTVTLATDLGFIREDLLERFNRAHIAVIESNHDPEMLENSGRPAWLKDRIRSIGHLSNGQCAEFVVRTLMQAPVLPRAVILAHISRQCNTPALAVGCTGDALREKGLGEVRILPSYPWRPNEIVSA